MSIHTSSHFDSTPQVNPSVDFHAWSCLDTGFESETFTVDLLKDFDFNPTRLMINDKNSFKQDDITLLTESYSNSLITNQEEKISMFSTLETIESQENPYIIKQHQNPSTSAAAIEAAAKAVVTSSKHSSGNSSDSNNHHSSPSLLQNKSILKKSSAFFNEKILRKKPSIPVNKQSIKEKRSSGFIIKPQEEKKSSWWRTFKKSFT